MKLPRLRNTPPPAPVPPPPTWKYHQASGRLERADGSLASTGYSGHGSGKNNCSQEGVVCVGPIPRGTYKAGNPHDSSHTGPFTLDLTPDAATASFITSLGRDPGSFKLHGDNQDHTASEGCIIMPRVVREEVAKSANPVIEVVAE